ncbi:MAG TPA: MFS transporter [Gemmataceae bacterium]|jgi:MFS family permease|nr:MFS transporter [Gemmataceae bacterium]
MASPLAGPEPGKWYRGITGYQWLVLVLASAGWIFDVFEGQIFNITSEHLLVDILPPYASAEDINFYGDIYLGVFLVGGTLGGIVFGSLADRWGRRPTLVVTILMYSVFSGLTYFASGPWQVAALRFLVAIGVGGEWSVAATLVAEVFPARARAQAASIFHASSIIGTWLAVLAGLAVGTQWRYAYLVGVLPALLVLVVRASVAEPTTWLHAKGALSSGNLWELVSNPCWRKRALLGLLLAAVGLGTFWSVSVAGQKLAQTLLLSNGAAPEEAQCAAKIAYGIVQTTGGGLGLLSFGPLSVRWGRRPTFIAFQLAGLAVVPLTCYAPVEYWQLLLLLPLYGFCTLGVHAGYAVYFPELFPTRLRATGAGFCFNGGRLVAASVLVFSAWLKALPGMDLRLAVTLLSGLFLVGVLLAWLLPETKNQPLPE